MELIVAVYEDWGIGCGGTQPVALSTDRKFFRQQTKGAAVIFGRKTLMDFPGQKPLPNRENILLSSTAGEIPGITVCRSVEEAVAHVEGMEKVMVIGGGSVYRQMLPLCDTAYVTKVHTTVPCDTYFPDLDADPQWKLSEILLSGEENGIPYEMCLYKRK